MDKEVYIISHDKHGVFLGMGMSGFMMFSNLNDFGLKKAYPFQSKEEAENFVNTITNAPKEEFLIHRIAESDTTARGLAEHGFDIGFMRATHEGSMATH